MTTTTYPSPVDKLLTIGKPEVVNVEDWANYLELGLSAEHIPDLLRMLTDDELLKENEEKPEGWGPFHALRALGQIGDVTAVEPLLNKSERLLDYKNGLGEWGIEELPEVYGLIGPAAIPALIAYIADKSHGEDSRINASTGLAKIAEMHPEAREEVVAALTQQLESTQENLPELNAFIIDNLIHMKAVEAAPVIEQAFATDSVDMSITGDWDDVQAALGLKPPKEMPIASTFESLFQPSTPESVPTPSFSPSTTLSTTTSHKRATAQKSKHKMAKQSRKKNRRKK